MVGVVPMWSFGGAAEAYRSGEGPTLLAVGAPLPSRLRSEPCFSWECSRMCARRARVRYRSRAGGRCGHKAFFGLSSLHVALDWERFVVLRGGESQRLAGPGIFFTIPLLEYCTLRVDQRTQVTPFGAEETLARGR